MFKVIYTRYRMVKGQHVNQYKTATFKTLDKAQSLWKRLASDPHVTDLQLVY